MERTGCEDGVLACADLACGHVAGMLDRDQRTAKLASWRTSRNDAFTSSSSSTTISPPQLCHKNRHNRRRQNHHHRHHIRHHRNNHRHHQNVHQCCTAFAAASSSPIAHDASADGSSRRRRRRSSAPLSSTSRKNCLYLRIALKRLKQALIAGLYLLSLVGVPCTLSAPARGPAEASVSMSGRQDSRPKWVDPLGFGENGGPTSTMINTTQGPRVPDVDLLAQIISQARIALSKADQFKDDFAKENFGVSAQQLHDNWKDNEYRDWLPTRQQIPKGLNEMVSSDHLQSLRLDSALVDTYHYLQMVAVGLEQVVWDQEDTSGPFLQSFNNSEFNLRLLLSEIQTAVYERGVLDQMKPDVMRDWMPDYLRTVSNVTNRKMRDWIIYRDYMNALEYVIQVFEYLKAQL